MNRIQALHSFWSGFGLPAYDENSVPDEAMNPDSPDYIGQYITYDIVDSGWDEEVTMMANLWYYSSSWKEITEKAMAIGDYITRGGVMIPCDEGAIWIKKAPTWAQRMAHEGYDMVRRILLTIEVEYVISN